MWNIIGYTSFKSLSWRCFRTENYHSFQIFIILWHVKYSIKNQLFFICWIYGTKLFWQLSDTTFCLSIVLACRLRPWQSYFWKWKYQGVLGNLKVITNCQYFFIMSGWFFCFSLFPKNDSLFINNFPVTIKFLKIFARNSGFY